MKSSPDVAPQVLQQALAAPSAPSDLHHPLLLPAQPACRSWTRRSACSRLQSVVEQRWLEVAMSGVVT